MTLLDKVINFVDEFPEATDTEIAENLNTTKKIVQTYLRRLKNRGAIVIEDVDDKRRILVNELPKEKPIEFKRGVFEMMVEKYLDDFKEAELFQDRVEIGKMIVRILEKL